MPEPQCPRTHQNICQVVHTVVFTVCPCLSIDREGVVIVFRILFLRERGRKICDGVSIQIQSVSSYWTTLHCLKRATAQVSTELGLGDIGEHYPR